MATRSGRTAPAKKTSARSSREEAAADKGRLQSESQREIEEEAVTEHSGLPSPAIYEVVRRRGDEEMERPGISLCWSGVAAGLSISFSLLGQTILRINMPDTGWAHLVSSLGYSIGFVMVVLGRQQLFTENTLTAVLPVMAKTSWANLWRMLRMWGIVFGANMMGTFIAAMFCTFAPVLSPEMLAGMHEIGVHLMGNSWAQMFFKAIAAGFLIATMVWLLPNAEAAEFWVIVLMTSLIAAGGFAHIVAGSVEAFLLVLDGQIGLGTMLMNFTVPVLLGNVVGGTMLFALISYAQVMKEI